MTGVRIRLEVEDAIGPALDRLLALGADLSPAMDDIGAMLVASTLERFQRGEAPDGTAWPPSERVRKHGGQTLVDTGRLRDSITHAFGADFVEVGTNVVYAAIHQLGGRIKRAARTQTLAFEARGGRFTSRRKAARRRSGAVRVAFAEIAERVIEMPARPFLGVSDDDAAEIEHILAEHVARAAGAGPQPGAAP